MWLWKQETPMMIKSTTAATSSANVKPLSATRISRANETLDL
jgi:hypothetical protein